MRKAQALLLAAAVGLSGVVPRAATAQDPARMQQQMMTLQQQMQHLTRLMDRVSGIQDHAHQMERQMVQAMERLQQNRQLAAENAVQLRNQERLRSMAQAMTDGAREMHRAMEQLRNMVGDPAAGWDQQMEREMEQLRQHWEEMAGQMEEGLRIMERLRDRIHPPSGG